REGTAHSLPYRRHALRRDASTFENARRVDLAHQDHVEAGYFRKASPPGRPHQDQGESRRAFARARLPRFYLADAIRRESGSAFVGQTEPDARYDKAWLRARVVDQVQAQYREAVRHGPGYWTNRKR